MKIPFSSLIWQQHTRLWVNGLTCNSKGKTLVKNTNGWTWISFGLRREVKRLISLKNHSTILIFSSKWIPDHLGWDSTKNHYKWLDSSISGTTTSKHISWLQLSVLPTIYFFTNFMNCYLLLWRYKMSISLIYAYSSTCVKLVTLLIATGHQNMFLLRVQRGFFCYEFVIDDHLTILVH